MNKAGRRPEPERQEQTRQALKQAARQLLEQKSCRAITIREIAQRADTQSAMVSYYFGGKDGLFKALIDDSAARRQQVVGALSEQIRQQPQQGLGLLINQLLDLICLEPWLVRLLQDDVLAGDSQLREHFLEVGPGRLCKALQQQLQFLQQQQQLASDLDIQWLTASLMSLIMFPVVAEPIVGQILGIDRQTLQSDAWKAHIERLLTRGLTTPQTSVHSESAHSTSVHSESSQSEPTTPGQPGSEEPQP